MAKKTYRQAINEALRQEMERDHRVILMGEDVAGGLGAPGEQDAWGGPLGVTKGLMPKFGRDRVLDTPISESAFIGAAVGAAATGLRPVAELMFVDFIGVCFDQIFNQAAKFRYMFGGKAVTPLVIRTMYGAGFRAASQHSQCLYPMFTHIPGLKVVLPCNAYEAKGLLIQAIRDDDPVIFFEHKAMYDETAEVPDEAYTIPFGEANVTREGDDVTIVTMGRMVNFCNQVADKPGEGEDRLSPWSTCARPRRSIPRPCWRRRRRPAVWSSSTRPIRAATWRPTSRRSICQEAFERPQGADQDGHRAALPGAVLAGAGGSSTSRAPAKIEAAVRAVMGKA